MFTFGFFPNFFSPLSTLHSPSTSTSLPLVSLSHPSQLLPTLSLTPTVLLRFPGGHRRMVATTFLFHFPATTEFWAGVSYSRPCFATLNSRFASEILTGVRCWDQECVIKILCKQTNFSIY